MSVIFFSTIYLQICPINTIDSSKTMYLLNIFDNLDFVEKNAFQFTFLSFYAFFNLIAKTLTSYITTMNLIKNVSSSTTHKKNSETAKLRNFSL